MGKGKVNRKEYIVNKAADLEVFWQRCRDIHEIREYSPKKKNEHFFESFDWRLYDNGYLCKKWGKKLYLTSIDGELLCNEMREYTNHFFPHDLPAGQFQDTIGKVMGVRALSEIVLLKKSSSQFDLLNKDSKTVVRLFFEDGVAIGHDVEEKLLPTLRVVELKGYEKAFKKIVDLVDESGLTGLEINQTFFERAITAIGRKVNDYSSSFTLKLEEDISFNGAAARICLHLLNDMEKNYSGLLADIDTEFLHDFRVAMRRMRSFLGQFKKSLPIDELVYAQNELKWLGSLTGPVRDLDVYLLGKSEYMEMLPAELHSGLEEFFIDLTNQRIERFAELRKGLVSPRYDTFITQWQSFLKQLGADQQDGQGESSEQSCRPLALKTIRRRFDKILKDGRKLNDGSPDDDLHELRIQGKKLRYLLEFFNSFFDEDEVEFFRKQLKKLQNNLGDFNDTSVQLDMLTQARHNLTGRSKRSIAIAAAIGGLITHLSDEHGKIRKRFEDVFDAFASEKNIRRFHKILS